MLRVIPLLVLLSALHGAPVAAHGICGMRSNIIAQLALRYGEARQGGALPGSVMHMELYISPRTGTWTVLKAHPPGLVCIERTGRNWRVVTPAPKGKGT